MGAVTAIAERYRELGFRVIEGGKSSKLVVIDSLHLGRKFSKNHGDVLESIDNTVAAIKCGEGQFRHQISDDVRLSTYTDKRGKPWRYYLLTETGFELVASGWDAVLRYELLIAFRELREEFGRGHSRPVAERLHQLRGDWIQGELFERPTSVPTVTRRLYGPRLIDNPNDPSDAPIFGYEDAIAPTAALRRESWHEHCDGVDYVVTCRYREDKPWYIRIMLADLTFYHERKCWFPPCVPQAMLTWEYGKTPDAVFLRVLDRLGINSPLVTTTLLHLLR